MIYEEYLEKAILNYCKNENIKLINGAVPAKHVPSLMKYLKVAIKSNRNRTREFENINSYRISRENIDGMGLIESPIEQYMLEALHRYGLNKYCKPQFQIGTKRVDFAFPAAKLVVECDGRAYHFSEVSLIEKDQKRDVYLAKKGWVVKHFDGLMIRRNIKDCIDEIKIYLKKFIGDI